jgi:hypothetical protein
LLLRAQAAVEALGAFTVRHGVDDLPSELTAFGHREDWSIEVPPASEDEEELLLRLDRALRVANAEQSGRPKITNDPRFHVGWKHYDEERRRLEQILGQLTQPAKSVIKQHLTAIGKLRSQVGAHAKMVEVGRAVKSALDGGEKVALFCHHHSTAQELAAHLHSTLPKRREPGMPHRSDWEKTWREALDWTDENAEDEELRRTFIHWLCSGLVRSQSWQWLREASAPLTAASLRRVKARNCPGAETITETALRLYDALVRSSSSRRVIERAAEDPDVLPGGNGYRVIAVCEPSENDRQAGLFIRNQQPDTVISVFNSAFGPDVLVATDKLSEGIDLHRYCRHLIHYELDPSPIRTVQRNGRIRRVNCWAAVTGRPIRYAYPAFRGTRDYKVVQVMKKRVDSFSLLLGGVQDFKVDELVGSEEKWRNDVIKIARDRLRMAGAQLRATEPERFAEDPARAAAESFLASTVSKALSHEPRPAVR